MFQTDSVDLYIVYSDDGGQQELGWIQVALDSPVAAQEIIDAVVAVGGKVTGFSVTPGPRRQGTPAAPPPGPPPAWPGGQPEEQPQRAGQPQRAQQPPARQGPSRPGQRKGAVSSPDISEAARGMLGQQPPHPGGQGNE